ncbi:MAG: tRNA (adenosine(37)-N6)-threonylcarbamoyltransferase complex ATPase subunit type 1 TsaE [Gammaproteobacteria bacterium]|nr:tRNA (adenosine(37)-N6)-threonylcarbamoyltransferase complex ATPase subunit type 1 TsaE [Gammaproteobacteria bacterium]
MAHIDGCWLADESATLDFGAGLVQVLRPVRGVVTLSGPLGAGKTTLVRGLLRACGVGGPIHSPTYTLVEPYDVPGGRVLHLDLYRIGTPAELLTLGIDAEPPETALWLVEWPEHAASVLPPLRLALRLGPQDGGRRLQLRTTTAGDAAAVARLCELFPDRA